MSNTAPPSDEHRDRAYAQVARDVLALYDRHLFAEGLQAAEAAVEPFPEFSARTSWFRACLLCRLERFDEAVEVLRAGVDHGEWWSEEMLRTDGDITLLRWLDGFEEVVARSVSLSVAAQEKSAPTLAVLEPEAATGDQPRPVLIALHGSGGLPGVGECWELACDEGWLVALPRSSRLVAADTPVWDDLHQARHELQQHLKDLKTRYRIDERRIVLAGFSQGASVAVELGVEGRLGATGVLAVAPWFDVDRPMLEDLLDARPPLYLVMGQDDRGLKTVLRARAELERAGFVCHLDERPGVGHEFPPDGKQMLQSALAVVGEPEP
ncbi:MAG: alpha/beta hydrolase [Acidimicrobiales bacterium]